MSAVDYGKNHFLNYFYNLTSNSYTDTNIFTWVTYPFFCLIISYFCPPNPTHYFETRHNSCFPWQTLLLSLPHCLAPAASTDSSKIQFKYLVSKKSFLNTLLQPSFLFQHHHRHSSTQSNYTVLLFVSLNIMSLTLSIPRPSVVPTYTQQVLKKIKLDN